jgi:aspartyl protease family protein
MTVKLKILAIKIAITFLLASVFIMFYACSGCSKSGLRNAAEKNRTETVSSKNSERGTEKLTIVKMSKKNGVYQIPVLINGVEMYFIFDTGAGLISISETEASFLYKQGKLTEEDIVGTANFIDASGNISEGTVIILKTVKIGDRILNNIGASVIHNPSAPILFGQSALEKFGKVSIDYNNSEITFE